MFLEILLDLSAIVAGASTSLLLYFLGADGLATVVVGADVAIAVQLVRYIHGYRRRRTCHRTIAIAVRSILDRHLDLTRIDALGFGDYMTLRHLAEAARWERLDRIVTFGGPAHTLGRVIGELVAELEVETARCYHELRAAGRRRVDAFAAALRRASSAATAMLNSPPYDPKDPRAASRRLHAELAAAISAVVDSGDALDRAFDPDGARMAATDRATSAAEKQRIENHAAAVLLRHARDAAQTLQLPHVQGQVPMVPLPELRDRLARAAEQMRNVDARAFREATDDARSAYRRLQQHDVDDAIGAAARHAEDPTDAEAEAVLRHRLARFPRDLATLEDVASGNARDVPPWPGYQDPDTPTLRAK